MPRRTPYVDADRFDLPPGTKATPLGGGRNSQVFFLDIPEREPLVFKRYFVDPRDKRDRQGTEARALRFLAASGVRESPRLLALDTDRQASMLNYVRGEKIGEPTTRHMDQAARFLAQLIGLSATEAARDAGFGPAAGAFFSGAEVEDDIRERIARLDGVDPACPLREELAAFRDDELRPALARHAAACAQGLAAAGMRMARELRESRRILSPADFSLRSALMRPDGSLCFFDYEYFGWDDPSKTLADFCLHPAMNLPAALRFRFLAGVVPALEAIGYDLRRAAPLFPLFGLKWCCLLLDEFAPRDHPPVLFADLGGEAEPGDEAGEKAVDRVLARRLEKARALLRGLDDRAETFARHMASL